MKNSTSRGRWDLPSFRVDINDFIKGNNSYDDIPDGAFISTDNGMNVFGKPGLLTIPAGSTAPTSGLPSVGVINWGKGKGSLSLNAMAVATNSSNDGYFYTVTDATGALTQVGSADTTKDYDILKSDTVYYQGAFYTSSTTDLTKNDVTLVTRDNVFWTTTKGKTALDSGSPHPLLVYADILFIANGRYLNSLDGTTANEMVLDLGSDWIITEMVVYNNQMRIFAEPYYNYAGTSHGLSKMFSYDTTTNSWIEEWSLNYRVCAAAVFDGTLFLWTKDYFGYWNGVKFERLRKMSAQINKHQIAEADKSLFFADGVFIVRYGSPQFGGTKKVYTMWQFSTNIAGLFADYQKSLVASVSGVSTSSIAYFSDVNTPGSSGLYEWTMNRKRFKKPIFIRAITIETDPLSTNQYLTVKYLDDKSNEVTIKQFDNTTYPGRSTLDWVFNGGKPTRTVRPRLRLNANIYVRSVEFYYEPSELYIDN